MRRFLPFGSLFLAAALVSSPMLAQPAPRDLAIAAAADLKFAMDDLASAFQAAHPAWRPKLTFGSSGNFFSQIQNGAPFDLFLSADAGYPRRLVEAGLGRGEDLFVYAVGRLALVTPFTSPAPKEGADLKAILLDPAVRRVAIANPKHAPYGRLAEAALRSLGIHDKIEPKLVLGENVAQAAQFVESGAAEAGLVALSLAVAPAVQGRLRHRAVPASLHPPLEQGGLILKSAAEFAGARAFRDFLLSSAGRKVLRRYGFEIPAN